MDEMIKEIQGEDTLDGRYLTFFLDDELYGIEIRHIIEIIGIQPITVIPDMPDYIKGITNLRGKIIPVMDARLRFKYEERTHDDRTCIIVLEVEDISMGVIVDAVSEVIVLGTTDVDTPPAVMGRAQDYIQGIGKNGEEVVMLLDSELLLSESEGA